MIISICTGSLDAMAAVSTLNTDGATGADYVAFMREFSALLASDEVALERMAQAEGRTIHHPSYAAFGAMPTTNRETDSPS